MSLETKKVTDPKTCQDFQSELRENVETRGYLTWQVDQLLNYLEQNCPTFSDQTQVALGKQAVKLTEDKETPLQSLYLVANLLRSFNFRPEELEGIGRNTAIFLENTYKSNLSWNEEDLDTRIVGWSVLEQVAPRVSGPLREHILDLSSRIGELNLEDDYIKSQALKLKLIITSQPNN